MFNLFFPSISWIYTRVPVLSLRAAWVYYAAVRPSEERLREFERLEAEGFVIHTPRTLLVKEFLQNVVDSYYEVTCPSATKFDRAIRNLFELACVILSDADTKARHLDYRLFIARLNTRSSVWSIWCRRPRLRIPPTAIVITALSVAVSSVVYVGHSHTMAYVWVALAATLVIVDTIVETGRRRALCA